MVKLVKLIESFPHETISILYHLSIDDRYKVSKWEREEGGREDGGRGEEGRKNKVIERDREEGERNKAI